MPVKCQSRPKRKLFFDYETDTQHAPYAILNLIGFAVDDGPTKVIKLDNDETHLEEFRSLLADSEVENVGFNIVNYDNQVSETHGLVTKGPITDVYLIAKSLWPDVASYSMKFLSFMKLGDIHWPEGQVEEYKRKFKISNWMAIPDKILIPYLEHDIKQLKMLHAYCKRELDEITYNQPRHQGQPEAYHNVEIRGAYHMPRMIFNGIYIDTKFCSSELERLQTEKIKLDSEAKRIHLVANLLSNQQVGTILDLDDYAVALTEAGNYSIDKNELIDLIIDIDDKGKPKRESTHLPNMVYRARQIRASKSAYENFLAASQEPLRRINDLACIPTAFSQSTARSRRFISGSRFGINFQNLFEEIKKAIAVPPGWIEGQVDLTSIEEVIHVYYTQDRKRREAYENNEDYSAYVELCNAYYGETKSKKEWDAMVFPANPTWSIYKAFKTAKLAANFGMGVNKFASTHRVSREFAQEILGALHRAQPAIRQEVRSVEKLLERDGVIYDPFGHAYCGPPDKAYKVVAYRIQGSAASLLKSCIWDIGELFEPYNGKALLCGTVHDSILFRMHKSLGIPAILSIMQHIKHTTTERYSPLFDNIPLRSKPSLSITNWADLKPNEFNWKDLEKNLIKYIS